MKVEQSIVSKLKSIYTKPISKNASQEVFLASSKDEVTISKEPSPQKSAPIEDYLSLANMGADILKALQIATGVLGQTISIISPVLQIGIAILGLKSIKDSIKEKDRVEMARGISTLLEAGENFTQQISSGEVLASLTSATSKSIIGSISLGMGIAGGTIETVLGIKKLKEGISNKDKRLITLSLLDIGVGASWLATETGVGAVPGTIALFTLFLARTIYSYRLKKQLKAEASKAVHPDSIS